ALRHRIRAAGLLVVEQRILLVRHEVGGDIYWIPPGGGFESECDESTKDTVRREFFEETGLRVDVGPLVYVREFAEPAAGRNPVASRMRCSTTSRPAAASSRNATNRRRIPSGASFSRRPA
ncbi:NUDIX domain-containing protein, partial [Pseudomonas aeruginosa]